MKNPKEVNPSHSTQFETDKVLIQKALNANIPRPDSVRAEHEQLLTYIVCRNYKFHHATLESATSERYFLQAALGKKVRIFKLWNVSRTQITDDFSLLRGMLRETENWDPALEALDRILKGAGH